MRTSSSDEHPMFQFTHPGRGATCRRTPKFLRSKVSIHAPREGCDYLQNQLISSQVQFQFTHPGRGATDLGKEIHYTAKVSIHAPREGCDIC